MSNLNKVTVAFIAVALFLVCGCVPISPGARPWKIELAGGGELTSAQIGDDPCYICALSVWDNSSKATLQELAKTAKEVLDKSDRKELPAIVLVFFGNSESGAEVNNAILQGLPFVVAYGSKETAENWALDVVPTLYYWNGRSLAVRQRGYVEAEQWRALLQVSKSR